jgi:hypothetical protein
VFLGENMALNELTPEEQELLAQELAEKGFEVEGKNDEEEEIDDDDDYNPDEDVALKYELNAHAKMYWSMITVHLVAMTRILRLMAEKQGIKITKEDLNVQL